MTHKIFYRVCVALAAFVRMLYVAFQNSIRLVWVIPCIHRIFLPYLAWKLAGKHEYVCNVHLSKMSPFALWLKCVWSTDQIRKDSLSFSSLISLTRCLDLSFLWSLRRWCLKRTRWLRPFWEVRSMIPLDLLNAVLGPIHHFVCYLWPLACPPKAPVPNLKSPSPKPK